MFMRSNIDSNIVIGDKLQHLLRINGFNTATLIKATNIDESTLLDYLNNVKSPTWWQPLKVRVYIMQLIDWIEFGILPDSVQSIFLLIVRCYTS
ncbi:hypothetical protein, partial [Ornithinibacillus hominis]|uniref:hypothetical protein n=1 Tax=Ornithinibacillus hominis TaxID=2763055 RepID=UPI0021039A73